MSHRLINRSTDLKRLQDEGYDIEIRSGFLLLKDVPYVNERRQVERGTLISKLDLSGDATIRPENHVAFFLGDYPCDKEGVKNTKLVNSSGRQTLAQGVECDHMFSSKPPAGYPDYYEKMTTYINILSNPAQSLDPSVTAKTFPVILASEEDSWFTYTDNASSRAGIGIVSEKLTGQRIAIIGLGGTGSYILDLLAKTPVLEIHLYDGDDFVQHNAFRAPGAASVSDLEARLKKVQYFAQTYSRMHNNIIPHPYYIDETNVDQLDGVDFAFICLDRGSARRIVIERLQVRGTHFIDCGICAYNAEGTLGGHVRVTTITSNKNDHIRKYIPFGDGEDNEYSTNIQIADLNALNAVLAVIKWKKLRGFYADLEHEHQATYVIDGNTMANEELK